MGGEESWEDEVLNSGKQPSQQPKAEPMVILHRDLSTIHQVGALLSISQNMMDFLSEKPRDADNVPGSRPLPGEARMSAEATLIKACAQLDSIIEDKRRWGIDYQLELERMYLQNTKMSRQLAEQQAKTLQAEQERAEEQRRAALEIQSPHFRYKPTLYPMTDGHWAAFLGDPKDLEHGIVGIGANPGEALKSFDMVFSGTVPEHMKRLAENREKELNENDSVDKFRDQAVEVDGDAGDAPPAGGENVGA